MRAIAVLGVLVYHLNNSWLPGGFVGVDVFFVISGYLITKIILTEMETDRFSFVNFYARRIRRIFPALFVLLFFVAIAGYLLLPVLNTKELFHDIKYIAVQIGNFRFAKEVDYLSINLAVSPVLHTWSLAIEEQFYLVWPIFIVLVLKLWGKKALMPSMILVFVASLAVSQIMLAVGETEQAFFMFYTRAYELIIGGFLALKILPKIKSHLATNLLSILGGLMIMGSFIGFHNQMTFPGISALIPSLGAALIIYSGSFNQAGMINRFLSIKLLSAIGLISYSLYLWHWPLISIAQQAFFHEVLNINQAIIITLISFALAYLCYRYVEKPFRSAQQPDQFKKNLKIILIGISIAIVFSFLVRTITLSLIQGMQPAPLPAREGSNNKDFNTKHMNTSDYLNCVFQDKPMPEVIIMGDSHAGEASSLIKSWADEKGYTFQAFSISSCSIAKQSILL